jgi:hypothetical protein
VSATLDIVLIARALQLTREAVEIALSLLHERDTLKEEAEGTHELLAHFRDERHQLAVERDALKQALKGLADWVDHELDLSHEHPDAAEDDLATATRPEHVWRRGRMFVRQARAALAASAPKEAAEDPFDAARRRLQGATPPREALDLLADLREAVTPFVEQEASGKPMDEHGRHFDRMDEVCCAVDAFLGGRLPQETTPPREDERS